MSHKPKPYAGYDPNLPKSIIKISYPSGEEISLDDLVKKSTQPVVQKQEDNHLIQLEGILSKMTRKDSANLKKEYLQAVGEKPDYKKVIDPIFQRALYDANFLDLYIDLVKSLPDSKTAIKTLLNLCQDEFELESPAAKSLENQSENEDVDEMWEKEDMYRRRRIGNIVFLGELFKSGALQAKHLSSVIAGLLSKCSDNETVDETAVLEFCTLLTNIGAVLATNQEFIDDIMSRVEDLSNIVPRGQAQDALQDLLMLYHNGWQQQY